jgi:hypothetical protein
MFSLGEIAQMMTCGKAIEYQGEQWILLQHLATYHTGEMAIYLAVKSNTDMPAAVHVITAPAVLNLPQREQDKEQAP